MNFEKSNCENVDFESWINNNSNYNNNNNKISKVWINSNNNNKVLKVWINNNNNNNKILRVELIIILIIRFWKCKLIIIIIIRDEP